MSEDHEARAAYPYYARCVCVCGWRGLGYRRHMEDFPTCPRCGRIAARDDGPSLSVVTDAA